jgi:hypothetical protein
MVGVGRADGARARDIPQVLPPMVKRTASA